MAAEQQSRHVKVIAGLLIVISLILVGTALKAAKIVAMPLTFAFFAVVLIRPVQLWLTERLPRHFTWIGTLTSVILVFVVLLVFAGALWISGSMLYDKTPFYIGLIETRWDRLHEWMLANSLRLPENLIRYADLRTQLINLFKEGAALLTSFFVYVTLIIFLIVLMLMESGEWKEKVRHLYTRGDSNEIIRTMEVISVKVRQFLLIFTRVSLVSGVAAGFWLWFMRVDLAFLWGVLTFFLNFIPNIGSVVSVILPSLVALLQFGFWRALLVIGGLTAIEQVIGNYLAPRSQGKILTVSPVVVLVSIIFWSWVWGIAGAILAVPLTVTIIVVFSHIPQLQPVARMLSSVRDRQQ